MSIELVDKIDQAKGGKRYQKVGLNDLLLIDEEASVTKLSSDRSIISEGDYVGLELETVLQKRVHRKRTARFCLLVLIVSAIIALAVYFQGGNNVQTRPGHQNNNNQGGQTLASHADDDDDSAPDIKQEEQQDEENEIDDGSNEVASLWPTAAPLPPFDICKPKLHFQHHERIYHIEDLTIVPESTTDDAIAWTYTFSDLDISHDASIIAVGLSDFASKTDWEVGMVRVFAQECQTHKWKQLGQDLLGTNSGEGFGYKISSSKDGKVMAISAIQDSVDNSSGFVEVYYLDDDSHSWKLLGQRIENLEDTQDYYNLGTSMDISDNGETLAILGVVAQNKFVTRVFDFDYNQKHWVRKGNDLVVEVEANDTWQWNPRITLSEAGDQLGMLDPKFGLIMYHFEFEKDRWWQGETRLASFDSQDVYIEGLDFDETATLVAFGAAIWAARPDEPTAATVKVVDFYNDTMVEVYNRSFADTSVNLAVSVSQDGLVAAIVASRVDMDDNAFWQYDDVGALTVLSKNSSGFWKVIGKGAECEDMGVPGSNIQLSRDGSLAVVGTDEVIALYGISLNHDPNNTTSHAESSSLPTPAPVTNTTLFDICAPFPNATSNVGSIDDLPKQQDQHTLSISLNGDGSIVAVGIDSWDGEDRGMVRIFGWDCAKGAYSQLGQDLFGKEQFDGFGQSVDLSSDGRILIVGANQPPPGKAGYVDIYVFDEDGEWILDEHFGSTPKLVQDIGREVRISSDGSTVAIHGSFVDKNDYGLLSSFIRVLEKVDGEWKPKGDDLKSSIQYDEYGTNVKLSLAADGLVLGVTGSYNPFTAKMYTFDAKKSNWTETVIPPIKANVTSDGDDFDDLMENWFDGNDISLSDDGKSVAIAGTQWSEGYSVVRLLVRGENNTWTMSHDAVDYDADWSASSIAVSGDASVLAVGLNVQGTTVVDQGALYVSIADDSDRGWKSLGSIDGRGKKDLLGSRVRVSSDGSLAAASSRKGYVVFFRC